MQNIHPLRNLKTSVSLPVAAYRRLCAARRIFLRNGIRFSEQEIYRRLFKLFLKNWRGHGRKTNGLRRYNAAGKNYHIHPLYVNQVLHAALSQRSLHSGESISRMLDVAIRLYLPRLLESLLEQKPPWVTSDRNARYWAARYQQRRHRYPDFFINYECQTQNNGPGGLKFLLETKIISKGDLSLMDIWNLAHIAA